MRAVLTGAAAESQPTRQRLVEYYLAEKKVPQSLGAIGLPAQLPSGVQLALNPKNMALTVHSARGELIFTPKQDSEAHITWTCSGGEGTKPAQLPAFCR